MNRWVATLGTAVVLGLAGSVASADTVTLHDGKKYEGKITSADDATVVVIDTKFGPMQFAKALVATVTKGDVPAAPAPTAAPTPVADAPAPAETPAPVVPAGVDPKQREKFAEMRKGMETVATGAEGAALLDAFIKAFPTGSLSDLARKDLVLWKDRADKNLVRWGSGWSPKDQVDAHVAKADELVGKADAAGAPEEAAKLLLEAGREHPFRADIPFKRALSWHKANKPREATQAFADTVKADANHVAGRNNLGVMMAQQAMWDLAIANLVRAAGQTESDVVLDNLDQVIAMADAAGAADATVASYQSQVQQVVRRLQAAGKRSGENRWGASWISQADYDKYMKENAEVERGVTKDRTTLANLKERYSACNKAIKDYDNYVKTHTETSPSTTTPPRTIRLPCGGCGYPAPDGMFDESADAQPMATYDPTVAQKLANAASKARTEQAEIERKVAKLKENIRSADSRKNKPTHSDKLVLINADCSELETLTPNGPKGKDSKDDKKISRILD